MSSRCHGVGLAVVVCFASPHIAQAYSVGGTVSIFAGVPNCNDSDQVSNVQQPSTTTAAGCAAANGASASGTTRADLTTGSVGVDLLAFPVLGGYAGCAAQSSLTDQLHFTVAGGIGQDEDLLVPVTFTLNGALSADALFDPSYGRYLDYNFNFSDFASFADDHALSAFGKVTSTPFVGPTTFSKVVKIRGAFLTANVSMDLFVPGLIQGDLDFAHTATIELDLPPGVTFTSDSGVFLSPEPGAASIAATGVATLMALARRNPRRR